MPGLISLAELIIEGHEPTHNGGFNTPIPEGGVVKSEFYQLRRTAIKDVVAYCAFLLGFIGSAPLAWRYLSSQLESGEFVRGLWYFFALVAASGLFLGIGGLALGVIAGWLWEQNHRRRRRKVQAGRAQDVEPSLRNDAAAAGEEPTGVTREASEDSPFLRLVPENAPSISDLSGRKLTSIRFFFDRIELDFGGVIVLTTDSPVIVSGLQRFRYPDPGSRDALCGLIGASVEAMRAVSGERIEIRFSPDRQLIMTHARSRSATVLNRS
ncbi:MAG: hypothetical protein M3O61_15210 [Gemmatimonadota bacterium]|nr:hypothetical protein [Gemmatimonadota bacterium]